jgi:predicted regulator of Ras-like GTPase activity (Roadblock/LC7/MglB family)
MTFKDILKGLVQETGAVGATLMGMDGIPIEQHISEGAASDIEALGVEYGRLVSEA